MVKASRTNQLKPRLHNIRDAHRTRRSRVRDSNHQRTIIYIDYDPVPNEIIEALQNSIEPYVVIASPRDNVNSINEDNSIEITYEELNSPDLVEISRERLNTPEPIRSPDINDEDRSNEISHNSDASLAFALLEDLETRAEPSSPRNISEITSTHQSTIEFSPSPSYSPSQSPLPAQLNEEKDNLPGDITPGLLDSISDTQLLDLIRDINWTFLDDSNL